MSDLHDDMGSPWVRLRRWLNSERAELTTKVMTGELERDDYLRLASRAYMMDQILAQMQLIAEGRDRSPPRERLRHVEEP